ncbi:MAG TPA: acyclic terpene utilization AtuA family protein, partial [Solimonas sp.]|nr:acyclic terpene utilization AtuA family protein [Solimonas sp.]
MNASRLTPHASRDVVRIGCGAGFWGDSAEGPKQLVESGEIDYLVLDYLAEITMSLLAKARANDANAGYATDLPSVIANLAAKLKAGGIKLVTNAGGVNPLACKAAIEDKLKALNIELKIAIVTGDDLLPRAAEFADVKEMFSGEPMPAKLWSMNAYLGAQPIAQALAGGADIVLTGRCVDSALVLGPLIHEFGWAADDYDRLSAGSLAGHIIECGAQATGGIVTDWRTVVGDWDRMGFPIAICEADGRCTITKPAGTGGRVTTQGVAEQIVYEIGDPAAYLLPDVSCDWRDVQLRQVGDDRVEVSGARGRAPGDHYKVSATYQDGFRVASTMMIGGVDAVAKAEAVGAAILKRTRTLFAQRGLADYTRTDIEVLGSEANWGANARRRDAREVILKVAAQHADKAALDIFGREFIPPATAMAQGITGFAGGRPTPTPMVRLFSCLVPKSSVTIEVDGRPFSLSPPSGERVGVRGAGSSDAASSPVQKPPHPDPLPRGGEGTRTVPLIALAYGRSGDKGDAANIGVLARKPEYVAILRAQLTADAVKQYFAHFVKGAVERFEIPGLHGFNFLMHNALGGGGTASLRYDPQGKMLAQVLMD